ncbi:MAG: PhoX family phosphatase, partial [Hyphomonadaceae bacterium]
ALFAGIGISVVQLEKTGADWRLVRDARPGQGLNGQGFNRRITPFTPVSFSGPAANHRWIASGAQAFRAAIAADAPHETVPCGTLANCAGGQTPWGTYLTAEENFDGYFAMTGTSPALEAAQADAAWLWACGNTGTPLFSGSRARGTPAHYDVAQAPYGPALYGWVVEIDPYDPASTPKKRTALGRFKHECATTALSRDGRVIVYSGDDQAGECVYKFISAGRFDPANRAANANLLDDGQLYVAKLEADGSGRWLPLTAEAANAAAAGYTAPFENQGDVVIRAREAARLLEATPMDRPEDVEAILDENWVGQGQVFIACTNNRAARPDAPGNPLRAAPASDEGHQPNLAGHVLRFEEAGGDCASLEFRWDVFVFGGDPDASEAPIDTPQGVPGYLSVLRDGEKLNLGARFACPDNLCFDRAGNVWIATDGSPAVFGDCNDSVMVVSAAASGPKNIKRFLTGPVGAEICGPTFARDGRTFFAAIQHPGESDAAGQSFSDVRWGAAGAKPASSFPDGAGAWPRSAVVYVVKEDGGLIGE